MDLKTTWAAGALAGCLVVGGAGYVLLVSPQQADAQRIDAQVSAAQAQQATLRSQVAMLTSESTRLSQEQAILARAQSYIPLTPALPSLIRQLSAATDGAGVDLVSLSPSTPTLVTAAGATTAAAPLYQVPVSLHVTGGFFEMENFLSNLEQLPRAFVTTGFSVSPQGNNAAAAAPSGTGAATAAPTVGKGELSVTVTGEVFMTTDNLTGGAATGVPSGS